MENEQFEKLSETTFSRRKFLKIGGIILAGTGGTEMLTGCFSQMLKQVAKEDDDFGKKQELPLTNAEKGAEPLLAQYMREEDHPFYFSHTKAFQELTELLLNQMPQEMQEKINSEKKLNILYPGAGSHMAPLEIILQMIDKKPDLQEIQLVYTEIEPNAFKRTVDFLKKLEERGLFKIKSVLKKKYGKGKEYVLELECFHKADKPVKIVLTYALDRSEEGKGDPKYFKQAYTDQADIIISHDMGPGSVPVVVNIFLESFKKSPGQGKALFIEDENNHPIFFPNGKKYQPTMEERREKYQTTRDEYKRRHEREAKGESLSEILILTADVITDVIKDEIEEEKVSSQVDREAKLLINWHLIPGKSESVDEPYGCSFDDPENPNIEDHLGPAKYRGSLFMPDMEMIKKLSDEELKILIDICCRKVDIGSQNPEDLVHIFQSISRLYFEAVKKILESFKNDDFKKEYAAQFLIAMVNNDFWDILLKNPDLMPIDSVNALLDLENNPFYNVVPRLGNKILEDSQIYNYVFIKKYLDHGQNETLKAKFKSLLERKVAIINNNYDSGKMLYDTYQALIYLCDEMGVKIPDDWDRS